ncbi:MAG: efflux RND transporter permease subunit, partial [Candidatus Limnocylindria bacterium]
VPLATVADISLSSGPEQINRRERQRAITIQVTPPTDVPLEEAMLRIEREIVAPLHESGALGEGYHVTLSGTADKLQAAWDALKWNFLLALLITYLLMAALFESFFYPLIIMTSVALALVGGFGGLAILNIFTTQPLDMLTMLGFVILIGTVVNNAILIVHQSLNYMHEEGMTDRDAIVESVRTRLRPISMTTLTTVLGMLPLVVPNPTWTDGGIAWVAGAGSELYRGLGSVVLGGLIVSTVFTMVLIPLGFSLALDLKKGLARLLGMGRPEPKPALAGDGVAARAAGRYHFEADTESVAPRQKEPVER